MFKISILWNTPKKNFWCSSQEIEAIRKHDPGWRHRFPGYHTLPIFTENCPQPFKVTDVAVTHVQPGAVFIQIPCLLLFCFSTFFLTLYTSIKLCTSSEVSTATWSYFLHLKSSTVEITSLKQENGLLKVHRLSVSASLFLPSKSKL